MAVILDHFALAQGTSFPAMATLVHDIPGRLRFTAPLLKDEPGRVAKLRASLERLDAVRAVHFNGLIGSVLVEYDARSGARDAVVAALDAAGCRLARHVSRAPGPPSAAQPRAVLTVALKAAVHCVLDMALEGAIVAII